MFEGLQNLGIECNSRDCDLIIQRYDGDMDGKLGYWEFVNMFLPIDV